MDSGLPSCLSSSSGASAFVLGWLSPWMVVPGGQAQPITSASAPILGWVAELPALFLTRSAELFSDAGGALQGVSDLPGGSLDASFRGPGLCAPDSVRV